MAAGLRSSPNRVEVYDERDETKARDIDNDILGYAPRHDRHFLMKMFSGDKPVVKVLHSIDRNDFRMSSARDWPEPKECILFFGGSIPFGEGVEKDETVPHPVAETFKGRCGTYNVGYFYYGGHQMLAALRSGVVERIVNCEPRYAIYFGLIAHLRRAILAGVPFFQRRGPICRMDAKGRVILEARPRWVAALAPLVDWSRGLLRLERFVRLRLGAYNVTEEDVRLYVGIVSESRDRLRAAFPNLRFYLIAWNKRGNFASRFLLKQFLARRIRLHLITDIFSTYDFQTMGYSLGRKYMLNGVTWHYNAKAYRKIAAYIESETLDGE